MTRVTQRIRDLLTSAKVPTKGKRPITEERKAADDKYAEMRKVLDEDRRTTRSKTKPTLSTVKWGEKSALPTPPKPPKPTGGDWDNHLHNQRELESRTPGGLRVAAQHKTTGRIRVAKPGQTHNELVGAYPYGKDREPEKTWNFGFHRDGKFLTHQQAGVLGPNGEYLGKRAAGVEEAGKRICDLLTSANDVWSGHPTEGKWWGHPYGRKGPMGQPVGPHGNREDAARAGRTAQPKANRVVTGHGNFGPDFNVQSYKAYDIK